MHQLGRGRARDDGGRGRCARAREAGARVARAEREGRAEPLAARGEQVPGDIPEEAVLGADGADQTILDPDEVGREGREPDIIDQGHAWRLRRRSGRGRFGRLGMIRAART